MPYKNKAEEEYHRNYRINNRLKHHKQRAEYKLKYPWINSFKGAKKRCNNPNCKDYKNYGAKGIKFLLTKEEIAFIWDRDKAYNMDYPTLDRIKNNGNYELNNCQFLENIINSTKDLIFYKVTQYNKDLKIMAVFKNQCEASRETGVNQGSISDCIHKNRKYAGGFIWKQEKKGIK